MADGTAAYLPVREDFLDFPTGWRMQSELDPSLHDIKCSSVPGSNGGMGGPHFLCDCGAIQREWGRRVDLQRLAVCDVWCDLEGHDSPHLPRGHAKAYAALNAPQEVPDGR